jgi:aspartate/methionine/tyrosine aminotransferase
MNLELTAEQLQDAMQLNEMLISRAGVAGLPGNAFADSDMWDSYLRLYIAREDKILQGGLDKIQSALSERHMGSFRSRAVRTS